MNWYEIMERELKRADTGAKLMVVPEERRATGKSLSNLERDIIAGVKENDKMRFKSCIKSNL